MKNSNAIAALRILDNMTRVVEADRLAAGRYVEPYITQVQIDQPMCNGSKVCAIGSCWIAAGVKPVLRSMWAGVRPAADLDHTDIGDREGWLNSDLSPKGLRQAYDALNAAARKHLPEDIVEDAYEESGQPVYDGSYEGWLEILFEKAEAEPKEILDVIREAKEIVYTKVGL